MVQFASVLIVKIMLYFVYVFGRGLSIIGDCQGGTVKHHNVCKRHIAINTGYQCDHPIHALVGLFRSSCNVLEW